MTHYYIRGISTVIKNKSDNYTNLKIVGDVQIKWIWNIDFYTSPGILQVTLHRECLFGRVKLV